MKIINTVEGLREVVSGENALIAESTVGTQGGTTPEVVIIDGEVNLQDTVIQGLNIRFKNCKIKGEGARKEEVVVEQHTVVIAGEELKLTLEGTKVTLATGGEVIETKCEDVGSSYDLFGEVSSDLSAGSLYLEETNEWIAICSIQPDGTVKGDGGSLTKRFSTFKDFVKWGSKANCNLY